MSIVLVISPSQSNRNVVTTFLEMGGRHTVLTASDGTDAGSKFDPDRDRIDVVLADVGCRYERGIMPAINTARVFASSNPRLRVIGFSDQLMTIEEVAGTHAMVQTPFHSVRLPALIQEVLDR